MHSAGAAETKSSVLHVAGLLVRPATFGQISRRLSIGLGAGAKRQV